MEDHAGQYRAVTCEIHPRYDESHGDPAGIPEYGLLSDLQGSPILGNQFLLVDREPVANIAAKYMKADFRIVFKGSNRTAVRPTPETVLQALRQVKMIKGNDRLDPVFLQFIQDAAVERDPFLVGLFVVPVGEDTAPAD